MFSKNQREDSSLGTQIITELDSLAREQDEVSIITHKIKCSEQRWVPTSPEKSASAFEFLGLGEAFRMFSKPR